MTPFFVLSVFIVICVAVRSRFRVGLPSALLLTSLACGGQSAHAAPPDPGAACVRALAHDPALQPLAAHTALAFPLPRQARMPLALLADPARPGDEDKPLLQAWSEKLRHCYAVGRPFRAEVLTPESQSILASQESELEALLVKLYAGELTYGEFNRGRQDTYDRHADQAATTAQKLADERAAQAQAAQQAAVETQRSLSGDSGGGASAMPGGYPGSPPGGVPGVGRGGYSAPGMALPGLPGGRLATPGLAP